MKYSHQKENAVYCEGEVFISVKAHCGWFSAFSTSLKWICWVFWVHQGQFVVLMTFGSLWRRCTRLQVGALPLSPFQSTHCDLKHPRPIPAPPASKLCLSLSSRRSLGTAWCGSSPHQESFAPAPKTCVYKLLQKENMGPPIHSSRKEQINSFSSVSVFGDCWEYPPLSKLVRNPLKSEMRIFWFPPRLSWLCKQKPIARFWNKSPTWSFLCKWFTWAFILTSFFGQTNGWIWLESRISFGLRGEVYIGHVIWLTQAD